MCKKKKVLRSPLLSSSQIKTGPVSSVGSLAPPTLSSQVKASPVGFSFPSSPVASNVVSMPNSGSVKEDQVSIISRLGMMVREEKTCREIFSQKLSGITALTERDQMIASYVKERNQRIETFNLLLKKVIDFSENQRLIKEFHDTSGMCGELNVLNDQYVGVSKEKFQKRGDIVEKYNGYLVESKRQQIRRRVEDLMSFTANNPSICPNKQGQGISCAMCHLTESVGLLPCGDYVHVGCLVEEMIAVWKKGYEFVYTCPGSCGSYLGFHYFLFDDAYAKKPLTLDGVKKEIFFKPRG
ncbi:MAG: hypothetical protein NMK33_02130 [Candidatus Cardinium sp.]|uniref:hypothetical protein n=1 Tax=Cardinium endosymbiont of Dermatophagoides farinae TaxID=2597823 RepID=UPI0011834F52|nr:hypothetical protein [Cardinium endosymbiont of Dermatophagoides farinae]UWW97339.1 MAG: hypothetical protein NMK33_02130 [Candidatus Cardinium sp.]